MSDRTRDLLVRYGPWHGPWLLDWLLWRSWLNVEGDEAGISPPAPGGTGIVTGGGAGPPPDIAPAASRLGKLLKFRSARPGSRPGGGQDGP